MAHASNAEPVQSTKTILMILLPRYIQRAVNAHSDRAYIPQRSPGARASFDMRRSCYRPGFQRRPPSSCGGHASAERAWGVRQQPTQSVALSRNKSAEHPTMRLEIDLESLYGKCRSFPGKWCRNLQTHRSREMTPRSAPL